MIKSPAPSDEAAAHAETAAESSAAHAETDAERDEHRSTEHEEREHEEHESHAHEAHAFDEHAAASAHDEPAHAGDASERDDDEHDENEHDAGEAAARDHEADTSRRHHGDRNGDGNGEAAEGEEEEIVESVGGADAMEEVPDRAPRYRRQYKIQEVIKRRQIMLVQVVKEERGTKGAALTTYLSLAGRFGAGAREYIAEQFRTFLKGRGVI